MSALLTAKSKPTRMKPWARDFLDALIRTCNVTLAAKAAGVPRRQVHKERVCNPEFAAAWDDAWEQALDILEAIALQRARERSDQMLMFLLKSYRPHRFRENVAIEHSTDINIRVIFE